MLQNWQVSYDVFRLRKFQNLQEQVPDIKFEKNFR